MTALTRLGRSNMGARFASCGASIVARRATGRDAAMIHARGHERTCTLMTSLTRLRRANMRRRLTACALAVMARCTCPADLRVIETHLRPI